MYAIIFDLDLEYLEQHYHNNCFNNVVGDIQKSFEDYGFTKQQGNVYFGDVNKINAVSCVLAVMDLVKNNLWFASSVINIRMLRIEDNNDLMPAVKKAAG